MAKVSCGVGHTAALTRDGNLLLWGCNLYGQCAASGDIIDIPVQFGRLALSLLCLFISLVALVCVTAVTAVTLHAWTFPAVHGAQPCCSKQGLSPLLQSRDMHLGYPSCRWALQLLPSPPQCSMMNRTTGSLTLNAKSNCVVRSSASCCACAISNSSLTNSSFTSSARLVAPEKV